MTKTAMKTVRRREITRFLKPKGEISRCEELVAELEVIGDSLNRVRDITAECGDHRSETEVMFEEALKRALSESKRMGKLCGMTVES